MLKCTKYMMAAAVAMTLGGFSNAQNTSPDGTSGPGKASGDPVQDRGTDQSQNPTGGDKKGSSGMAGGANANTNVHAGGITASGNQTAQQIRQFASEPDKAGDRLFALGAAMSNQWEVEFSRLVEARAQDQQVKDLARMIREDHEQANQKLMQASKDLNINFSKQLSEEKQAKLEVFRALPVDKLEKCYVGMQKVGHASDIVNYQVHQQDIQDPQLKQYVQDTLPKLQQHGQHVQQVAQAKGIQGGDITALTGNSSSNTGVAADRNRPGTGANAGTGQTGERAGTPGTGAAGTATRE